MMQVKNRACVRTVAVRSLWASKMRNLIGRDCNYADHDAVYRAVYDCNFHQRFVPAVQLSYGRRLWARGF